MEGRARDERHHGRRGSPAARVPRHPHRRADRTRAPAGFALSSETTARGPRSSGVRATCRRRWRPTWPCVSPVTRSMRTHMRQAAAFVRDAGGIERTRVFTRFWLALFGQWPWRRLPVLPPEMLLLPSWCPLNIYDFGCWARQTVVALTVVGSYQPVRGARDRPRRAHAAALRTPRPAPFARGRAASICSTVCSASTGATRSCHCDGSRSRRPNVGSSSAKRPTDRGEAFSRPGSTRSWRCTCGATPSRTR